MNKDQIIKQLRDMAKYPTVTLPRDCEALRAAADLLAQPEQEKNKNGSPFPEFWDWLPKAYNFEGDGNFTKYNMEVAFLAGKQASQPEQERNALPKAMNVVIAAMQADPGYAWSWHCNIAMAYVDEGVNRDVANQGAARFMKLLANVEPAHDILPTQTPDTKLNEQEPLAWESILGAVARGWCYEENANKTMDSELAVAIAKEVHALYTTPPQRKTCATCESLARAVMMDQTGRDA